MPSNRDQLNDRLRRRFQSQEDKQTIQDWRKTRNTRTPNQPSATTSYEGQLWPTQPLIGDGGGGGFNPPIDSYPAPTIIGDRGDLTPYPAPIKPPPIDSYPPPQPLPPHPGRPRYKRMPYQGRRKHMPPGRFNRFRKLLGTQPKYPAPSPYPTYPAPSPYPTIRDPYQPIADPYTRRY